MGQVSAYLRRWSGGGKAGFNYWCQGCEQVHSVVTEGPGAWGFNGNVDRPTFTPSVLVRGGHYIGGGQPGNCYCDYEARTGERAPFQCKVCHTFITEGMVQFLSDCTHAFAGQTVPLPELPTAYRDDEA